MRERYSLSWVLVAWSLTQAAQAGGPSRLPPLFQAISLDNSAEVSRLLKEGADIKARAPDVLWVSFPFEINRRLPTGFTALHFAVVQDKPAMIELLCKHGARARH